jgi:hypothetical protein
MQTKDKKNLNNKIAFKNILVPKNLLYSNTEKINIQTIKIDKAKNYLNEDKRFFSSKNLKKIRYLNNASINYNIKSKNYRQNDEQISFYDSSESNRSPSPINSLNQSSYITYTKKKKQKRHQKQNAIKNYQYSSSINNISFNSNVNNTIFLNSSSSSSSDNDYSESSEISYRSRDNKRKNYFDQMMIEENELDYLKKSEVGIITSEEEDNNNSLDNSNFIEENFNNEIERILIEIYNNNITLISSGTYNEINKNSSQVKDVEKQIKNYLKRENLKTNLKVLRTLSNKIKELVGKYKEKVFEIKEIKSIYEIIQRRQLLINNQIIHCNNSGESNVATNSNSNSLDYSFNEEDNYNFSNLISNLQDEKPDILLRELINIKKTLKISSKEIEQIFRYPLNLLKNENGKKIKFSIELMQREEFCKTLLNDEIISTILKHIKEIFCQNNSSNIIKMIEELEENCDHKNEMTRFVEYINNKLEKKKNENNKLDENKNENDEQINDNVNNKNHKEKKGKKRNNNENKNNNDEKEIDFKDIDALLNYINEDTDSKKGKKKGKKSKKNKKQNKKEEKEIIQDNNNYYDDITNNLGYEFEKEFENFKKEIEESSINIYNTNKIIPCLSNDFIKNISEL